MSKRPRQPGRRHVPGTFRTHERKGPPPNAEAQRIVLYLPVDALDLAEQQACRAKVESVQRYCETLLIQALAGEQDQGHDSIRSIGREGRSWEPLTVADDPDYLAEWTAIFLDQRGAPQGNNESCSPDPTLETTASCSDVPDANMEHPAIKVILRHAGLLGNDPNAFLTSLRCEGTLAPEVGVELIQALEELEADYRDVTELDRVLCFALHKLAFEGQILVTEGFRNHGIEDSIVDLLRLIQERVDRVLSGQNIRYFRSHDRNDSIDG
ncbi:hypothetical protein [Tautonia rosea]|uniref:hypothetical protein n=1 Tax=Tautonia rosea TaxID=2728037 RepID=UPI0014739606|nr:hypothetical protein [Tautonia rosea]